MMTEPSPIPVSSTIAFNTVPLEQPVATGTAFASELLDAGVIEKRPFFTDREKTIWQGVAFSPIALVAWLLAQPIKAFSWVVIKIRTRRYDPEKIQCPACGFRGDSGTGGKAARVVFAKTNGNERAALQHFCFRCGCDKLYSPLVTKADKWMAKEPLSTLRIQ